MARVFLQNLCLAAAVTLGVGSVKMVQSVTMGQEEPAEQPPPEFSLTTAEIFNEASLPRPSPPASSGRTTHFLFEGQFHFQNGELVSFQPEELFQPEEGLVQPEERISSSILQPSLSEPRVTELFPEIGEQLRAARLQALAPSDSATPLTESSEIQTVNVQRRSSISFDPRVRGYHLGQLLTHGEGVYWMPVRPDLDSMLSKIDPQLIQSINVISGPYTARLGPGFSFIDTDLLDTPRYEDCPESHNRIGYDLRTNGGRQYFHDTLWGGSADYGYIINYGFRNGSDYLSGNRTLIPGSYNVNNVSSQLGFQLSEYTKLEARYDFMDQTKTQYPGQFFRVDRMQTNNISFSVNDYDDPFADVRMRVDGWHNRTPMRGSLDDGGVFRIRDRIEAALNNFFTPANVAFTGTTAGSIATSGGRLEALMGEPENGQFRLGTDLRFIKQTIQENFSITGAATPPAALPIFVDTQMPRSEMLNPGIYSEAVLPVSEYWTARLGGRVDFVHTTANGLLASSNLTNFPLQQSNTLYAFYLMNDLQINDCWTANVGFGQAQRPPTLLERYADGVFVSVLQSGFTRVIGDPNLNQERLWQVDGTLSVDYGYARMSGSAFQSWILDYITLQGVAADPTGASLVRYRSTPLATLSGFEFRADADLNSSFNAYLMGHYVQGHDQTLDAPLPGISPFDSRFGLLWHSVTSVGDDDWGVDTNVRVVSSQDRLGVIRQGSLAVTGQRTVETFTPSFTTVNIRGYWNPNSNVNVVGGIENLFNENYLEHLDLRLPAQGPIGPAFAYAQGITPYLGVNVTY